MNVKELREGKIYICTDGLDRRVECIAKNLLLAVDSKGRTVEFTPEKFAELVVRQKTAWNEVTLCLPYYLNRTMLQLQFEKIRSYSKEIHQHLQVIVVDDGSPRDPAAPEDIGCPLQIFRMGVDIRWNQDACRNLAVSQARTKWVLLTDIDHLVPEETMRDVMTRKLSWKGIYRFGRISAPLMQPYKPHPNSWLLTVEMYDRAGGYDERFAGWYGTDSDFRDRLQAIAKVEMLPSVLVRVGREVVPDASTTTYARKTPEDNENLSRIKRERRAEKDQRPKRNLFPWTRVC